MKNLHILEKEDIKIAVMKMAFPMVASQIVAIIYNLVDRYFVSNYVSSQAFAGIGVGFPIFLISLAFLNLFLVGTPILYGRALGEKNMEKASAVKHGTIIPSLILIVIVSGTIALLLKPILTNAGATANTLPHAYDYYVWIIGGLFTSYLNLNFANYIRAEGSVNYAMWVVMIGAFINIGADYVTIVILKMGTSGAAIATILSQCIGALMGYIHQHRSKVVKFNVVEIFKPHFEILINGIKLSTSAFFTPLTNSVLAISVNYMFVFFCKDTQQLDSYMLVWSLIFTARSFVVQPVLGFSMGGGPLISFNYGAKNKQRVIGTFVWTIIYTTIFLLIPFWVYYTLFNDYFIKIFNIPQTDYELTKYGMNISYAILPVVVSSFLLAPLMQSLGRITPATITSVLGVLLSIPIGFLIVWKFGIQYIWYIHVALGVLNISVGTITYTYVFRGRQFNEYFIE